MIEIKRKDGTVIRMIDASTLRGLHGADLRGADLRGADLRGADLAWADLYGADLTGADLSAANLIGANLCGAIVTQNQLSDIVKALGTEVMP